MKGGYSRAIVRADTAVNAARAAMLPCPQQEMKP
ncbi:MAG: hypothetical protein K0S66_1341 [Sphingomonas sp.]|jgi:hypothetical protein|nr:hypothetical protein [Sphingomonas sp.]